jgi:hypothetical protein
MEGLSTASPAGLRSGEVTRTPSSGAKPNQAITLREGDFHFTVVIIKKFKKSGILSQNLWQMVQIH